MDAVVAVARKRHQCMWRRKSGITDHLGSFSPSSNSMTRKNMSVTVGGRSEAKTASTTPQTPKRGGKSRAIWIKRKAAPFSELWAGPAYAISPPPSSLPIPNFSLGERRSSSFTLQPLLKSAPRESTSSVSGFPSCHNDAATENLRRILNLDIVDDQKELCRAEEVLTCCGGA